MTQHFNNSLVFLDDGTLMGRQENSIYNFWNVKNPSIRPQRSMYWFNINNYCNVVYPGDYIVCASADGELNFFKLTNHNSPKVHWSAHDKSIFLLKRLKNGHLASIALDDTIKIWQLDFELGEHKLITCIKGHGVQSPRSYEIQELSNGFLVTYCNANESRSKIRVWNPRDGKMVKEIETPFEIVRTCLLSNDELVVGQSGKIHIFNLAQGVAVRELHSVGEMVRGVQLDNGFLVVLTLYPDEMCHFEFWDPVNNELIQEVPTYNKSTGSLAISKDEKYLAMGSVDSMVCVWEFYKFLG